MLCHQMISQLNNKFSGGGGFHSTPSTSIHPKKKKLTMVFQRIVNYWVSTFITEKLLSSPAFHRMAATTHKHVSNVTNKGMNPAKQTNQLLSI